MHFTNSNTSRDNKIQHLKNLASLARVDGELDPSEILFLYKIGKRFELNPQLIAELLSLKDEGYHVNAQNKEQNLEQLSDLVGMMLADGIIRDKELQFCKRICEKFGFKESSLDILISLYSKEKITPQDWEEVRLKILTT
jgi:uncharacterized tellurite resistance protein B-like protein